MALLRQPGWTADDIDHAVALHDLLETPDGAPARVVKMLRQRLTPELTRRASRSEDLIEMTRAEWFSSGLLDSPGISQRRLYVLCYLGLVNFIGFQTGTYSQLGRAINVLTELDGAVQDGGNPARVLLGARYESALLNLAAACYVQYSGRRELLLLDQTSTAERKAIKADLDRAVDASMRVTRVRDSPSRPAAMAVLGSSYVFRYEDDQDWRKPRTIDSAIALLHDALNLTEDASDPGQMAQRAGIMDRLSGALLIRNRLEDVDTAIGMLTEVRAATAFFPGYNQTGGALTFTTALIRRWMHTRQPSDRQRARMALIDAFATAVTAHLPTAVDVATQWGGWAWSEGWWAESGEAYGRAMRALHLAVRRQVNRPDRELILRKAPGVAAKAALGLARSGDGEAALLALETGRAVLLAETFDRRSIDYARVAAVAGREKADRYRSLTTEITRLETLLLADNPHAPDRPHDRSRLSADLEAKWAERFALRASMGDSATAVLSDLDEPPSLTELSAAAGPTPVIHLAPTVEGGIALILRDGAVSWVELPQLTTGIAAELVATLNQAVATRDVRAGNQVCEALWNLAMCSVLRELGEARQAVIIPGGRLSVLPWHAASKPDRPGTHVLDRLAISYLPNIRSWPAARLAANNVPDPLRALAIGQPMPTTARLLSADAEITAVCARGNNRFLVTRLPATEATAAVVQDSLSRFELIHFAGHAMVVSDNPLASALIMAHDQQLTVRDLLARGPGATRFAVLSACATARAEDPFSDEAVNFPTALLQCGLSGVVGSLWTSYDKPSAMVADIFYREWQGNQIPPAQALQSAQTWTRDHGFASPLAWANFVYVGP